MPYKDYNRQLAYARQLRARHTYIRRLDAIVYLGGVCQECGYKDDLRALEFHHVGPKRRVVSGLYNHSWKTLRRELDKCVLLCANCHRIRGAINATS